MNHRLKSYAVAACALVAVLALCFAAMAWTEPGSPPPAGNAAGPINTGAATQAKTGDLAVGGKLNVAGDFASGRFCLDGKCCATWEECFGVPAPPAPTCSCGSWVSGTCGAGACASNQRRQTRTCNPAGCDSESRCIADAGCTSGGPSGCERDSDCSAGYVCYNEDCCRLLDAAELSDFCEFNGCECGSYTNCGRQNINCGACAAGYCDSFSHKCCGAVTCQDMGYECGGFMDACGMIDCGDCPTGPVFGKKCVDHKCVVQ